MTTMNFNPDFKQIAETFVKHYYTTFDSNRANLLPLYGRHSMLSFEGAEIQGPEAIIQKLKALPFQNVTHIITTCDSQPIPEYGVVVHVVGQLKADNDRPMSFSQTFVLVKDGDSLYCLNDMFRLSLHHG